MIRAFITRWDLVSSKIQNPITENVEAMVPGAFTCSMFYPDADADGKPDGHHVLIFVEGDSPTIEQLDALDGVYMFPPYAFDTPMESVSQAVKDEVLTLCTTNAWMPTEPLFTAATYGDCLKMLAGHFQSGFVSFGVYEVERSAEFG